jgi:osmotically inducible protein OsmC
MKRLYTATVSASGGRDGKVHSADGKFAQTLAMPKELGGPGGAGSNPEQLFAAGYSACFDSALRHVARLQKIDVKESTVTAAVSIGGVPSGGFGLEVELSVSLPGLARAVAQELVEAAHKVCPYSNATRGNIPVELKLI